MKTNARIVNRLSSARKPLLGVARAMPSSSAGANVSPQKKVNEELRKLCSGGQMGHGLTMEQKEEVERVAAQLASMSSSSIDLKGTSWATIYTNASGGSSGKIGPFVSEVTQVFDVPSRVEDPPRYCNKALFYGALALKLEGKYKISEARIDLEFTRSSLELFGKEIYSKAFTPGEMQGFWKVQYADEEIRVFTTNRGSLFVLARLDSERLL